MVATSETDEKESTANDEDNDAEDEGPVKKPATRRSRRLLGKDEKESDSDMRSQPTKSKRKEGSDEDAIKRPAGKKQKMTIRKPSTPAKNALTPTSSPVTDDWAATSEAPNTSASRVQHGKLLPLLIQKDTPDIKKVQAELNATQSKVKALQKVNEELRAEADEAKKAGLGTRPLMTRLMHTARASQDTLTKLATAIADYQLTQEEKAYLYSLAEGNDEMTD